MFKRVLLIILLVCNFHLNAAPITGAFEYTIGAPYDWKKHSTKHFPPATAEGYSDKSGVKQTFVDNYKIIYKQLPHSKKVYEITVSKSGSHKSPYAFRYVVSPDDTVTQEVIRDHKEIAEQKCDAELEKLLPFLSEKYSEHASENNKSDFYDQTTGVSITVRPCDLASPNGYGHMVSKFEILYKSTALADTLEHERRALWREKELIIEDKKKRAIYNNF